MVEKKSKKHKRKLYPYDMHIDDFSALFEPNEENVIENLGKRYESKKIYSQYGLILVSINPFKKLNIYDKNVMNAYLWSS